MVSDFIRVCNRSSLHLRKTGFPPHFSTVQRMFCHGAMLGHRRFGILSIFIFAREPHSPFETGLTPRLNKKTDGFSLQPRLAGSTTSLQGMPLSCSIPKIQSAELFQFNGFSYTFKGLASSISIMGISSRTSYKSLQFLHTRPSLVSFKYMSPLHFGHASISRSSGLIVMIVSSFFWVL